MTGGPQTLSRPLAARVADLPDPPEPLPGRDLPEAVIEAAGATRAVVTVEEHSPFGGLGSMVAQVVGEHCPRPVKCLSLPDAPVITGTSPEVFAHYGLTGAGIAKTVAEFLGN